MKFRKSMHFNSNCTGSNLAWDSNCEAFFGLLLFTDKDISILLLETLAASMFKDERLTNKTTEFGVPIRLNNPMR